MKELIKFELKQRKLIILIFVIIISVISVFYLNEQNNIEEISKQVIIMNHENGEDTEYQNSINAAIINNDNKLYLESMINLDNYYLNNNYSGLETREYYQNRRAFNQYLLDHKIKSLNTIKTSYNKLEEVNGISAVYHVMDKIIPIILPLVILITAYQVFNIDSIAYNYLMTLPYHKKKILASKWLTVFIVNAIILLFTLVLSFVVGTLIGGSGDFNYPIVTNYLNINITSQTFISYYLYLPLVLIIELIKVTIYTTLGMLLANLTKNRWITLFISIIIGLIPTIYMFSLDYTYYSNLIPFVFDSGHAIVTYDFSLINKIGYILVIIIVTYFGVNISNTLFEKRER